MSAGAMAAYGLVAVLGLVLCFVFFKPLKGVLVLGVQSVLGGVGLYACNFLLAKIGLSVGVNVVTAAICGLFGLPGFVLLVLVKGIFSYL